MKQRGGYTILEVLIFVGVSAAIFFSAMTAIGGRQEQVQFAQAVREFDAKIRDILNDVTTGYFPTNETIQCEESSGRPQILSATDSERGTSDDCVFIGKVIQFQPDDNPSRIDIYPVVGLRYEDDDLTPSSSIATAGVAPVALPGSESDFVDATEQYELLYGLRITKVFRPSDRAPEYGLVGIFSQFGSSGLSDSQSLQVGGIVGSSFGSSESQSISLMSAITDDVAEVGSAGFIEKNTPEGIVICLESVDGNRRSSVAFGARGSAVTTLDIDTYHPECES